MGLGLTLVKWALLPDASTMPSTQASSSSLLAAMSPLALLGLRCPVRLLLLLL